MEYNVNLHMTSPSTNTSSICLFNLIILTLYYYLRFPCGSDGKEICLPCGRPRFDPWVGKIPWGRVWQPTPVFPLEESHGQRSLVGYSPWGRKQSDTTEPVTLSYHYLRSWRNVNLSMEF